MQRERIGAACDDETAVAVGGPKQLFDLIVPRRRPRFKTIFSPWILNDENHGASLIGGSYFFRSVEDVDGCDPRTSARSSPSSTLAAVVFPVPDEPVMITALFSVNARLRSLQFVGFTNVSASSDVAKYPS